MHNTYILQGINISHLGKRKIIFKIPFLEDMLVSWRVVHSNNWEHYCETIIFRCIALTSIEKNKNHTSWQWFPSLFVPLQTSHWKYWNFHPLGWVDLHFRRKNVQPWIITYMETIGSCRAKHWSFPVVLMKEKQENPFTMMYGYFYSLKKPTFRHAAFGKPSENWAESMTIPPLAGVLLSFKHWRHGHRASRVRVIVKQITRPHPEME